MSLAQSSSFSSGTSNLKLNSELSTHTNEQD